MTEEHPNITLLKIPLKNPRFRLSSGALPQVRQTRRVRLADFEKTRGLCGGG